MPRRSHRRRRKQDPHLNGLIHQLLGRAELRSIYNDWDNISRGRLVAAAEWVPGIKLKEEESRCQPQYGR